MRLKIFKRDPAKYKQPQEYYCSNPDCLNEIAKFNPLSHVLTKDAWEKLSNLFCMECIIEGKH